MLLLCTLLVGYLVIGAAVVQSSPYKPDGTANDQSSSSSSSSSLLTDLDDGGGVGAGGGHTTVTLLDIAKLMDRSASQSDAVEYRGPIIAPSASFLDADAMARYRDGHNIAGSSSVPSGVWLKFNGHEHRTKRSIIAPVANPQSTNSFAARAAIDEIRAAIAAAANEIATNEIVLSDELMNAPLSQLDLELIERSPLMKLIRLLYYLQVKRSNLDYNPRLGRRSASGAGDECNEFQQRSPYSATRCLGKKDMQYTPRLGRRSG